MKTLSVSVSACIRTVTQVTCECFYLSRAHDILSPAKSY